MGADSLFYFDKWVHPEIILENADVLVASRDKNGIQEIEKRIIELKNTFNKGNFDIINCPNTDCASSVLREYIEKINNERADEYEHIYVEKYLPDKVYEYIFKNHLY